LGLAWQPDPTTLGTTAMQDPTTWQLHPTTLGPAVMQDPTTVCSKANARSRNS